MELKSLEQLFVTELRNLYDAETRIFKSLPRMAKAASADALRIAFEDHRKQTKEHIARLERIFKALEESPKGRRAEAIRGSIEEAEVLMHQESDPAVLDAGLISAGQKVEHFEIASYGCVRTYAEMLGYEGAAELLGKTLAEEEETDKKLTELATSLVNPQASRAPYAALRTGARTGAAHIDSREGGGGIADFLLGLGIGTGIAMLFAPQSGRETRENIREKANEGRDYVVRRGNEIRESAEDLIGRGRELLGRQRQQTKESTPAPFNG